MDTRGEEKKTTSQKKYGHGEDKTGAANTEMARQHRGRYEKYEMTADMAENTQYMEMMEKTGPQTCGVGL